MCVRVSEGGREGERERGREGERERGSKKEKQRERWKKGRKRERSQTGALHLLETS